MSTEEWLLDSDPSIRWQVRRDLGGEADDVVAAERARVAGEGWGARLLALQQPDGHWGGGVWVPGSWASTFETLALLRELGLDPSSPEARQAIARVGESCDWGPEWDHSPFFEGEVEPCINGRVLAIGAYFGEPSERLVARLLGEQLPDGGWNCDAPASERSSFNTTLCVLEGLLEYERSRGTAPAPEVRAARLRGHEFLLERRLFRRLSTGEAITRDRKTGRDWRAPTFPTYWCYDVLRALDYLRAAGDPWDDRASEAVDLVRGSMQPDGRWLLAPPRDGRVHFVMEQPGAPSRWVTLRALRVLDWFEAR